MPAKISSSIYEIMAQTCLKYFLLVLTTPIFNSEQASLGKNHMIIGGQNQSIIDAPYMVSLRNRYKMHVCGGAIISENWILTAAHCSYGQTLHHVVCGTNINDKKQGTWYKVKTTINYPFNTPGEFENDIGMVKTRTKIEFTPYIQPIDLPYNKAREDVLYDVSGWGMTRSFGNVSTILKTVKVQAMTNRECEEYYVKDLLVNYICALTIGKGPFFGDSGSPLVLDGQIHGIVSWGSDSVNMTNPDVYLRVFNYKRWIYPLKLFYYFF